MKPEPKKKIIEKIGSTKIARKAYIKKKVREFQTKKQLAELEQKEVEAILGEIKKQTYPSIHTCSIYLWYQLREQNDLTWLLKEKREVTPIESKCLAIIYKAMENEYLKEVGISDKTMAIIETEREIIELCCRIWNEGDDTAWTWLDIAEDKLKNLTTDPGGKGATLLQNVVAIERICKCPSIDILTCSVAKYNAYVKMAEDINNQDSE